MKESEFYEQYEQVSKERAITGSHSGEVVVKKKNSNESNFSANTNLITKKITSTYNPVAVNEYGEENVLETADDIIKHEVNHHKYIENSGITCVGCPQTAKKDHDFFFLPAYNVLSKKGFTKRDVNYVTNALEDTILHADLEHNAHFNLEGIKTFFTDVGKHCDNKKFTEYYEAHVKLNMYLWGNKKQKKDLSQYYTHSEKVKEVLTEFLKELGIKQLTKSDSVYKRSGKVKSSGLEKWVDREEKGLEIKDLDKIQKFFLDENNWEKISEIYAKHFSKLMTSGYACPTPDDSGSGTNGNDADNSQDESDEGSGEESNEGNVFQRERETPEFKKGEVVEADVNGTKIPGWIDKIQAMEYFYQNRVEQLIIKAESYTNAQKTPVSWYNKRPFNSEKDNMKHVGFGFSDKGDIELKKKRHSIDLEIPIKDSPKSFPQIKFGMIDISASMLNDIFGGNNIGKTNIVPWGDNSRYHWAIQTQLAIWEYLKRNHLLVQNDLSTSFFGQNTGTLKGLQNIKEKLFNPQFENSTNLDWEKIKSFFEGRGNLLYTISDGQIGNWEDISEKFIQNIIERNHSYLHLHMGTSNNMTDELQKNGMKVVFAENEKGIVEKVIDLTDKIFRGGLK